MHNYNKSKYITNTVSENIPYDKVLDVQIDMKNEKNEIYVLSTFPLFIMDYNYDKTMEVLKMKLKENYLYIDEELTNRET